MTELLISCSKKAEEQKTRSGQISVTLATVFSGIDLIFLCKVPRYARKYIEEKIEPILNHELLHVAMNKIDEEASVNFDNLFANLCSYENVFEEKGDSVDFVKSSAEESLAREATP